MMQCTLYLVAAILVMSGGLTTAQTDCFEEDIAYLKSKKIKSTGAASPEDCQADCKETAGCVWWTWRPESLTSTGKTICNLKAKKKNRVTKTGAVSGPKECPPPDCFEVDIAYHKSKNIKDSGAASPEDCQADCKETVGCVLWTWLPESVASTGKTACNLKATKNTEKRVTKTGAVSGPKECSVCDFQCDTCIQHRTFWSGTGYYDDLGDVDVQEPVTDFSKCIEAAELKPGCNVVAQMGTYCTCYKVPDVNNIGVDSTSDWITEDYNVARRAC